MTPVSNSPKPRLACEVAADRVLVGRLAEDGHSLDTCGARELAPGSVVPDLVENNLRQPDAVVGAIHDALTSLAGRSHDVIAVVPDAAVRVVLLEFDTLPNDAEEAEGVVRFRLKKSLPFDVDKTRVSYHAQKSNDGVRVVAGVALARIVEDYADAFRQAGFSRDPLQLFRTLGNTRGVTISGEQLAEEVYPSIVFFQDTYHLNIEKIFVAGVSDVAGAAPALRAQTGGDVQELVSSSQLGASTGGSAPRGRMAGVVGALIS